MCSFLGLLYALPYGVILGVIQILLIKIAPSSFILDFDKMQYGFQYGFGTIEALFSLIVLLKKCRDQGKMCLPSLLTTKNHLITFNMKTHWSITWSIDQRDIQIIKGLYCNQTARVWVNKNLTKVVRICRGVRQGRILFPLSFKLYSDIIFKKAFEKNDVGIKRPSYKIQDVQRTQLLWWTVWRSSNNF